jgi:integrase
MLSAVVGFYAHHARSGNDLAKRLVDDTRSGRGGYKPFLNGLAPSGRRGRVIRLREREELPKVLKLEQLAAVVDAQDRLRDRFLFALLAETGMRIGQALGLRHDSACETARPPSSAPELRHCSRRSSVPPGPGAAGSQSLIGA